MNVKRILIWSILICNFTYGQVTVERNLNLELVEKDSLGSLKLEKSLNSFLTEAQNKTYSDDFTDSIHLKKYEFFFTKLSGIGKHDGFHQPLVLKSYPVGNGNYRLTIGFTGARDGQPFIYQMTELKAKPYKNHYRFYCPFEDNTSNFKSTKFDNITYHYSGNINQNKAKEFVELVNNLSNLTNTPKPTLDYYSFQNLDELLKSYGFLYSARQCNFLCYDLGFTDNEGKVYVTGTNNENYIFGYLGDYLYYNLPNNDKMYWPFVQGVSTYYGGYGLSYETMEELKQQFRNELKNNPTIDFLEEFKKGRKSSVNRHFSYYVMSAFLCEEVIKKKTFEDVLELIYSGENGEIFFENLDKVLGVTEDNFHETILKLIGTI